MRSVGIDIAKVGYTAIGLAIDGEPAMCTAWKPQDDRDSEPVKLVQLEKWLHWQLGVLKPDIIVVEELAVFLNKKVIRALARREGVALLVARKKASLVMSVPVTQARSVVLGPPGNMSKEEAWKRIKDKFPDFDFGHAKNDGGMDKGDAMTHALAGPIIIERR